MGTLEVPSASICREGQVLLMGVLNATPDSFFDGGRYAGADAALRRLDELVEEGADLIDIGGESSRPGAASVSAAEQLRRIEPVVRHALTKQVLVSIDTSSAEVAERMLALGASFVNDVSCLADARLAAVTAAHGARLILMHSRNMADMTGFSRYPDGAYGDVVADVRREWRAARDQAMLQGMPAANIYFDPGIGFAKNARHSYELLARLAEFRSENVPIVVGPSRKSFIGVVDDAPPEERLGGTIAACLLAAARGAGILRVHDVRAIRQALRVTERIQGAGAVASHAR